MIYIKFDIISLIISILISFIVHYGLSSYNNSSIKKYNYF